MKHDEAKSLYKLRKNQDKHLFKHENKSSQVKGRVSQVANQLREQKQLVKREI